MCRVNFTCTVGPSRHQSESLRTLVTAISCNISSLRLDNIWDENQELNVKVWLEDEATTEETNNEY